MLKRNTILSILFLILSITYFSYTSPLVQKPNENNNFNVNLSSLSEVSNIGNRLTNESLIVVNLWASWCIPCIEEVDELIKISENNKYYVIGLLVDDSMKNGQDFINEYGVSYENILNEDHVEYLLAKFNWTGIPTTLILNLDYDIIQTINGPISFEMISDIAK